MIAQAIPILVSPLIARLYAPGDLGTLALFSALTAVLCVLATCRLELVIPLVRTENEALRLLAGIGMLALSVCTLLSLLLLLFWGPIAAALHDPGLATWLWYLPLSVLAVSLYQALTYWFNRRRRYLEIAYSRVAQSAAAAGCNWCWARCAPGPRACLLGALLGQFIALARLAQLALRAGRHHLRPGFLLRCWAVLRRHRRFPLFMVPGQMANVASLQVAVVLLSLCYGACGGSYYYSAGRARHYRAVGDCRHRRGRCVPPARCRAIPRPRQLPRPLSAHQPDAGRIRRASLHGARGQRAGCSCWCSGQSGAPPGKSPVSWRP
ncbi:oligosaccharide flippase family protein [Massilia sp. B-10]|nr:oligosaccharide flippase family protein [Massilia sp. B-10]